MLEFLTANWDSVLLVVAFVVLIIFLLKRGYTTQVNEILFYLVSKAEQELGGGTGQLKYAAVTTWLYERLPAIAKFIFTTKQIDIMIESAVTRMKEYLKSNAYAEKLILSK